MHHFRKTRSTYARHNKGDTMLDKCTFCNEVDIKKNIIAEGKTMFIIPNRVSYDMFEGRRVLSHLMIIPKRHVESLKDFTNEEAAEMVHTSAKYEAEGYNVYARGVGSISRSVRHQHTHLIKLENKKSKAIFFIRKPYFLIKL